MENNPVKIFSLAQVKQIAVRLLARREHSSAELRRKLQQRGCPPPLIQQVLEKLIQQGLLSEQRFVEAYVRARSLKNYGPVRITAELQQRGISMELIAEFIDDTAQEWLALAEQIRQKRFGKKIPKDFTEKAKQMRFLQYRGFNADHINKLLSAIL